MPDWIDTLDARAAGEKAGFLAANVPLEDQDVIEGGLLPVKLPEEPKPPVKPLELLTKAELVAHAQELGLVVDDALTKAQLVDVIRSA